jgi:hypothetical protein
MKQLTSTLILILLLHATSAVALPDDFPPELVGTHSGGMGQLGHTTDDGTIMFSEHRSGLGGVELRADGKLIVPFAEKQGELFTELEFPFVKECINGAMVVWKPLIIGEKKYTAKLFRYGKVFRVLVKLYNGDRVVSGIQWVCAEPTKAEQDAVQSATDTEEPTPAPPKNPLVGKWAATSDQDNRVVVTFNSDGTFELLMVDPETPERVKARGTGRYKTDLSVSPAHLDLDMSIEKQNREEPVTHKFKMIFEIIDENSFRMSGLESAERPKAFDKKSVVLRRQVITGAKSD